MRLSFDEFDKPVRLDNCATLLPLLEAVLNDWPFIIDSGNDPGDEELLSVARTPQGYVIHAPWLDEPQMYADEVDAACGLVAELIIATVHCRPDRLCLHGAAVEYKGRLIFFPSRQRAGKSTLVTALTALGAEKGIRIFADDVLMLDIETGQAIANGIAPRVRLPLPKFGHPGVGSFIHDHILLNNQRYAYLATAPEYQMPRGTTAPIAALIQLHRGPQAGTGLVSCSAAATLEQVIRQNFATTPPAPQIFDTLQLIVEHCSRHAMHYTDSSQAAELILTMLEQLVPALIDTPAAVARIPERLHRIQSVYKTLIDGEAFLVNARTNAIYKLDPLAGAIWQLLEQSHSLAEIINTVQQAFPEIDAQTVQHDVEALLQDMTRQDLIGDTETNSPDANQRAKRA